MKVDIPRYYQDAMYRHLVDSLHWGPESMTREAVLDLATACLDAPNATERGLIVEIYKRANAPIILQPPAGEAAIAATRGLDLGLTLGEAGNPAAEAAEEAARTLEMEGEARRQWDEARETSRTLLTGGQSGGKVAP